MKHQYLHVILLSFLIITAMGCNSNKLRTRYKPYYKEYNSFNWGSIDTIRLDQSTCYDRPRWNDEESCEKLEIEFTTDSIQKLLHRTLDLKKDSALVKIKWRQGSIWMLQETHNVFGTIKITHWSAHRIRVKMNLIVANPTQDEELLYFYKGSRTFRNRLRNN